MKAFLEKKIVFDSLVAHMIVKFKPRTSTHDAPSSKASTMFNDNSHQLKLDSSTIDTLNFM